MLSVTKGSTLRVDAPEGALSMRLAGGGQVDLAPVAVVEGQAKLLPSLTKRLVAGEVYVTEFNIVDGYGDTFIKTGPRVKVMGSIAAGDVVGVEKSVLERAYDAAQKALLGMSGSGAVSFSSGENQYSFESRNDLLSFVNRLRSDIGVLKSGGRRERRRFTL